MPNFPTGVTPLERQNIDIAFVDVSGQIGHSTFNDVEPGATAVEIAALRDALGNLSTAGVIADSTTLKRYINVTDADTHDEAFASVSQRLVFVLQNDAGHTRSVSIPAPDLGMFHDNRVSVNMSHPSVITAVGEIENVLNGGALNGTGTYSVVRAYRSETTRKLPKDVAIPNLLEPGAGDFPSGEPALPPGGE
jgi:hypothetical protein